MFYVIFWEKILWEGESPYNGKIKVTESSGMRRLVVGNHTKSRSLAKDGKTDFYWDSFTKNLPAISDKSKILILGLGAGTSAKLFTNKFGNVNIHGVEIDPLMVELGKKFFYLDRKNIKIFVKDAKEFVDEAKGKYEVICIDLFFGSKSPEFLTDREFLEKVKRLLAKDGVVIANKICRSKEEEENFIQHFKENFSNLLISRKGASEWNTIIYCKV